MSSAISRRVIAVICAVLIACTLALPAAYAGPPAASGKPMELPVATGNPYDIKVGDEVNISNFRRSDIPICFFHVSCLFTPNVTRTVTEVEDTKSGTRFRINGFGGYKGHPVYKDGHLIGVTHGSVGGLGYGYLFPTEQDAEEASDSYEPLATGADIFGWLRDLIDWLFGGRAADSLETSSRDWGSSTGDDKESSSMSSVADLFDPAGVDPREDEFAAANTSGWTHDGDRLIDRVEWTPGTGTFHVDPAKDAGHASLFDGLGALAGSSKSTGSFDAEAAWKEVVAAGVPDVKSLHQQFLCHAQGSSIRRSDWKLELGKPATLKQEDQARFACNPPAPVDK